MPDHLIEIRDCLLRLMIEGIEAGSYEVSLGGPAAGINGLLQKFEGLLLPAGLKGLRGRGNQLVRASGCDFRGPQPRAEQHRNAKQTSRERVFWGRHADTMAVV